MEVIFGKDVEVVVRAFYNKILRREPDISGAGAYRDLIKRLGLAQAVPEMLKVFLGSDEYRKLIEIVPSATPDHVVANFSSYGDRLIDGKPVSHIVSLGSHCLSSQILKNSGLKKYSLPFDWLFSSPEMVLDCLADDFRALLDRRHYRSITNQRPTRQPGAHHQLYLDRYKVGDVFAHRDPSEDEDYLYLVRAVERFRRVLKSTDGKLFLVVSRATHDLRKSFPDLLRALDRLTTNFAVIGVHLAEPTTEPGINSVTRVASDGEHRLYSFTPSSNENGLGYFPDKLDEWTLLRLIFQYKLALKESV